MIRWRNPRAIVMMLGLILVSSGCSSTLLRPDPPRISLAGIQLVSGDLLEPRFLLRLRLQNPNERELAITGLDYQLFLNGALFADGVSASPVTISPFEEKTVHVEVVANLTRVLEQVPELNISRGIGYRFLGHVKLKHWLVKIPFEYSGSINPLLL